ncbi:MAG: class I SAM-dependent methyltransferase [Bdellovibrionaceae bacterium]|nr:class I SAM-dependent methyltransferase [Bdellovibrio sp.]
MIQNRIEKNNKKLQAWAEKNQIEAYRVYDRDIPEYPFILDRYKDFFVIYDKSQKIDEEKNHLPLMIEATKNYFKTSEHKIIIKRRQKQKGLEQYQKLAEKNEKVVVKENGVPFLVNLWDYLDTGLFLDHRPLRYQFLKKSKGEKFLNLFCYTATVSVMAALSGASTVSIDMSKKYLEWAKENFALNKLPVKDHIFLEEDVLQFIEQATQWPDFVGTFDKIFLDPPTFSNSKSMKTDFDVERDQEILVTQVMKFLKPDGILYFSNNKRDFKLSTDLKTLYRIKDITAQTIPVDFHDHKIHHCFEIRNKA